MSIGVHNVGQGTIQFLRHDEEYTVNFPSGYGRSIFTVPWIELGGTVDIKCEKTGYSCTIQFHTKVHLHSAFTSTGCTQPHE
ncbi:hypothetical protein V5799_018920 [Amblyomma americanum]|uniref:Uncharacterized protein n=1 Tax=Amblyomma americanum TaxID=6943 RepID=A0AAQ4EYC3_AMBAM